jgi:hypothetical protein
MEGATVSDEQSGDDITIKHVGRDDDGNLLAIITTDEAFAGSMMLELLERGDDTTPWWELACGPGGWVAPERGERFRVLRIVTPAGKLLHDFEAD